MKTTSTALLCLLTVTASAQWLGQLALTPPMGWNSWNKFSTNIDETIIRAMADAMATNGMKDAGYQYINIDDCWQGKRDALGFIQPNPEKFPAGIKSLADYVHSRGLKLGIYSCGGSLTCGGLPGSRGHEYQDALTYAQWGVDYLKYDWCHCEDLNAMGTYTTMRNALRATGRPIVFSICEWGQNKPWLWGASVGQLWRTTTDIYHCFDCIVDHTNWQQWGVARILDAQKPLRTFAGPGHWNDPDMLEVGNGMSENEDRAHFSMWCMLAAPLISGNDLAHMAPETLQILTQKSVIAVDQDSLGVEAFPYSTNGDVEIWFKPLAGGDWAVCLLNRGKNPEAISFDWSKEAVTDDFSKRSANFPSTTYALQNLWTGEAAGSTATALNAKVPGHDVLMLRLKAPASATVGAAVSAPEIIRVKAGLAAPFTDEEGNYWAPERGFDGGDTVQRDENLAIANTKIPGLYRSEHYGMTDFSMPLPNGKYLVKLHFAETFDQINGPGQRVFSFEVAGRVFKDFDVFAQAGGANRALVVSVHAEISGGKLDIVFTPNIENPEINGIEIIPER